MPASWNSIAWCPLSFGPTCRRSTCSKDSMSLETKLVFQVKSQQAKNIIQVQQSNKKKMSIELCLRNFIGYQVYSRTQSEQDRLRTTLGRGSRSSWGLCTRQRLHRTPFTPDKKVLPQTRFTPDKTDKGLHQKEFTAETVYTRQRLHQTPYTPDTVYTRRRLHQTKPTKVYTRKSLHHRQFTPDSVYTRHRLHQTWFTPDMVETIAAAIIRRLATKDRKTPRNYALNDDTGTPSSQNYKANSNQSV